MKKILLFLLLFISLTISATTYYVAPSTASPAGSDSNSGTISSPWLTLNHALTYVSAGDIIYMRGGTYHYNTTGTVISGINGSAGNYINIWNYPGEKPVIDYGNQTFTSQKIGIYLTNCSYIYLKGIRITHINQPATGGIAQYGVLLDGIPTGASYCKFEQMESDHIGGWGFVISNNSSHNYFLNCDGHHNADPNTGSYNGDPYGWSDGFEMGSHSPNTSTDITFEGCRSWNNSDDGWDMRQADGVYVIKNCWSFHNGVREDGTTHGGDGECFKLGGATNQTSSIVRTVTNCLAAYGSIGFTPEPDVSPTYWFGLAVYNSVSYHNQVGVNFEYGNVDIVRNIVDYAWTVSANWGWGSQSTHDHNAGLDAGITLTNADFLSVDSTGLAGARQADGSLPVLNFLKLSSGSQLRGAGVAISGLTTDGAGHTYGTPPSIGAYEYYTGGSTAPTVTTTSASNIGTTTASSGGNITSDGGSTVTVKGVCWSTSTNPTTALSTKTSDGTGTGSYSSSITGLTSSTFYYVRAYATNSVGTSYGSNVTFTTSGSSSIPTVTTTAISSITQTTASSGGNVSSDGGSAVTYKGVCWSTSTNPTINNSHTTDGTGTGSFTSSIYNLTANTTYHVRAYGYNANGAGYGSDVQFTTSASATAPTVVTASVSNITISTAACGGNVTSDGGAAVTLKGVVWNTTGNPTLLDHQTGDGSGMGSYSSLLTSLSSNTTYYVRAYTENSVGTSYGNQVSFTTTSVQTIPVVTTTAVVSSTLTTVICGGNVISDGGSTVSARGVCWSTSHNPTTVLTTKTSDGTGTGIFSSTMTGLSASTAYYIRAYATNSTGTSYGAEITTITPGSLYITYP